MISSASLHNSFGTVCVCVCGRDIYLLFAFAFHPDCHRTSEAKMQFSVGLGFSSIRPITRADYANPIGRMVQPVPYTQHHLMHHAIR